MCRSCTADLHIPCLAAERRQNIELLAVVGVPGKLAVAAEVPGTSVAVDKQPVVGVEPFVAADTFAVVGTLVAAVPSEVAGTLAAAGTFVVADTFAAVAVPSLAVVAAGSLAAAEDIVEVARPDIEDIGSSNLLFDLKERKN